jgi:hypothetical protein
MEEITLSNATHQVNNLYSKAKDINSLVFVIMIAADEDMVISDFKGALSILYDVSEDFCKEIYELQEQMHKTIRSNTNNEND